MTGALTPVDQLGAEIMARIKAGDKAKTKADDHYLAAGLQLINAREQAGKGFDAFLHKHCRGLKRSRAYQLMSIAGGKTTVAAERTKTAERMRKQSVRHVTDSYVADTALAAPLSSRRCHRSGYSARRVSLSIHGSRKWTRRR